MIVLNSNKPENNKFKQSTFVIALLAVSFINLFGLCWQHKFNRYTGTAKTTNTLIDSFGTLSQTPHIVLLGSSLIKNPFWLSDIQHLAKAINYDDYHWCLKLQTLLAGKDLTETGIFNFGIPGAMVSDVYLVMNKLLSSQQAPKLLIYAVGPRDFNDRVITSEVTTPTFDRLFSLIDLARTDCPYQMSAEQRANFLLDRFCFAYRKRSQWQSSLVSAANQFLDKLCTTDGIKRCVGNDSQLNMLTPASNSAQHLLKQNDTCWNLSIKDYRARYASFNGEQFSKQCAFLQRLVETTKQKQIKLLLVNMPLTESNIALMPAPLYSNYLRFLHSISHTYKVPFIDLQHNSQFDQTCFYDIAHLNNIGGDRLSLVFSKLISDNISQANPKSGKISLCESAGTH